MTWPFWGMFCLWIATVVLVAHQRKRMASHVESLRVMAWAHREMSQLHKDGANEIAKMAKPHLIENDTDMLKEMAILGTVHAANGLAIAYQQSALDIDRAISKDAIETSSANKLLLAKQQHDLLVDETSRMMQKHGWPSSGDGSVQKPA